MRALYSKTLVFVVILLTSLFLTLPGFVSAAHFTSVKDGNWDIGTTWGGFCRSYCISGEDYPGGRDTVTIDRNTLVSLNQAASTSNITLRPSSTLLLNGYDFDVYGNIINEGFLATGTSTVRLFGAENIIIGRNIFYNLIKTEDVATTTSVAFDSHATTTVLNELTITATSTGYITLQNASTTTQNPRWKLDAQGTSTLSHIYVANSIGISTSTPLFCYDCGDGGNNQNWVFVKSVTNATSTDSDVDQLPRSINILSLLRSKEDVGRTAIINLSEGTKLLSPGTDDPEVRDLQIFLNTNGYIIAPVGSGSRGKETTYFGRLTRISLVKFQKDSNIPDTGKVDKATREAIAKYR